MFQNQLAVEILQNFQEEFKIYSKSQKGKIKNFFEQVGVKKTQKFTCNEYIGYGQLQNKNLNGWVIIDFNNGQHYIGQFKNNEKEGFGYKSYVTGIFYEGQFKQGKKIDGKVYDLSSLNLVYEGQWGDDQYHGQGVLNRRNGVIYEGQFQYNQLHGKGQLKYPNGDFYIGEFQNNKRHGNGEYYFHNKRKYIGQFTNNEFHGQGKFYWENGDIYQGMFEKGNFKQGEVNYSIESLGEEEENKCKFNDQARRWFVWEV